MISVHINYQRYSWVYLLQSMWLDVEPHLMWRGFGSGLFRLDCGIVQTIAAFDQFFQPLGETYRRRAVDHIVIKTDRQAQIVPQSDVSINKNRLLSNAAYRHPEGMGGERYAPTGTVPKHTNRREAHRPPVLLPHLRRPF